MAGFDQVGKDTGPGDGGFLITNKETPTQIVFEYILFNYNIDGNVLKKEHKELLDRDIAFRFHLWKTNYNDSKQIRFY